MREKHSTFYSCLCGYMYLTLNNFPLLIFKLESTVSHKTSRTFSVLGWVQRVDSDFYYSDTKLEQEKRQRESTLSYSLELPPPLPPRPGRGNVVYPNKPLIRPSVRMKSLEWNRIILQRPGQLSVLASHSEALTCLFS